MLLQEVSFIFCAYEGNCCGFLFDKEREKGERKGVRSESDLQQFHTEGSLNPCSHMLQAEREAKAAAAAMAAQRR